MLDFNYKRNVQVRNSSEDGKFKSDWSETVLPSLEATFGKDWAKILTDKSKKLYVAAEHIDSVIEAKPGKKNYGVPRFTKLFKNMAECVAAREEKYGSKKDVDVEEGELGIPKEIISQAQALKKSVKGNEKQLRQMLKSDPFSNYDADAIIAELS